MNDMGPVHQSAPETPCSTNTSNRRKARAYPQLLEDVGPVEVQVRQDHHHRLLARLNSSWCEGRMDDA